jgi:acetylornithine deacetylase/succinyl-diaminopimelate desuccinylase-like protein
MTDTEQVVVRAYIAEHKEVWLAQLKEWLRTGGISGHREYIEDVEQSAQWLAEALTEVGVAEVEVWETPGHPAVFGSWPAAEPAATTVLLYGHHDLHPLGSLKFWEHRPFDPVVVGEELRARGAIDDKGQIAAHLLGLKAHLAATRRTTPAVNLKFLIEGEAEHGSDNLRQLLEDHVEQLSCDVIVVSDTAMFNRDTPSICISTRGLVTAEITATGPSMDLHSGVFGGAVPNPIHALTTLLAGLHDSTGRVTIPGFYDNVVEPSSAERAGISGLPFDERSWLPDIATSRAMTGERGYSTLERIGIRPTAEVNGIWSGYTGEGIKTIIPSTANALVSFRLVANQDPAEIRQLVTEHIAANSPIGTNIAVKFPYSDYRPVRTPVDHPANQALLRAMHKAFETEIRYTHEGTSGPLAHLVEVLAAPAIFLGMALPDDRFHAPNERARLPLLHKGAEAAAYLWTELANLVTK